MSSANPQPGADTPGSPQPDAPGSPETPHEPFVPASESPKEFTVPAVLAGAILGIIFGA